MSLRKFQVQCKPAVVEEFERAYATETNEENLTLLADACINAERIEDVRKGIQVIKGVLIKAGPKKELLFALACGQLRCGEYENALATIDECLVINGGFWKAITLREIITTALAARASRMSRMNRLTYGALSATGLVAGAAAWFWSSPKLKMLTTEAFLEWKEASEKIENKMLQDMLIGLGVGVGAVSVGILVVGYFALLGRHMY